MSNNNQVIKAIANSKSIVDLIRLGVVQTGFELECQEVNGRTYDDQDREVDWDAVNDAASEAWDEASDSERLDHVSSDYSDLVKELLDHTDWYSVADSLNGELSERVQQALDNARDSFEGDYRDRIDTSDYLLDTSPNIDCRYPICYKDDGSVTGGEITTEGAVTPIRFLQTAKSLFTSNEFKIDVGCSFHIHLSAKGVKHTYGRALQAEMQAYILNANLPEFLVERIISDKSTFFQPQVSTKRYSLVNFCSRLNTWEFRVFGNVSNYSEAKYCLFLAMNALRHAYRVKLGLEKSLLDGIEDAKYDEVLSTSLKVRDDIRKLGGTWAVVKVKRTEYKLEQRNAA
jgi:hypothetical protein